VNCELHATNPKPNLNSNPNPTVSAGSKLIYYAVLKCIITL